MRQLSAPPASEAPFITLGVDGFSFDELYRPRGLRRLAERFDQEVAQHDPVLFGAFDQVRRSGGQGFAPPAKSELLVRISARGAARRARGGSGDGLRAPGRRADRAARAHRVYRRRHLSERHLRA